MSETDNHAENVAAPARWRGLMLLLGGMVTVFALLLALLPLAIEKGAVSWLQQHGVQDARIDNIDINLFSGKVMLDGLKSGDGLQVDHLSIDFDWLPLWRHIVHIRTLKLSETSLHMLESKGIWQVAGIQADDDKASAQSEGSSESHEPWMIVVDDLVLDAVDLRVKSSLFTLSLPLKSMRMSLSGIKHQRLINRIVVGDTAFSGFGYDVSIAGAKAEGDIGFSILSKNILASIKSNKLSLFLRGLQVRSQHDKRRIRAASVKLDGVAPVAGGHIRIASLALNDVGIQHALNDKGNVQLGSVAINGIDVGSDGLVAVAKLVVRGIGAEGVSGLRQSLDIGEASLADFALTAAKHIHIGSLNLNAIGIAHVAGDGHIALKHFRLADLDAGKDGNVTVTSLGMEALSAEGMTSEKHVLRMHSARMEGLNIDSESNVTLTSLHMQGSDIRMPEPSAPHAMQLLGAVEQASLKQFKIANDKTGSFERFKLSKIQLPVVGGKSMGSIGAIQASHAELNQRGEYHVRQLSVDQLQAHMVKRKGGWVLPTTYQALQPTLQPTLQSASQSASQPAAQRKALKSSADRHKKMQPRVLIDKVVIGAGSRIDIRDETMSPPLQTSIQIQRFNFAPLDSSGRQRGKLDALLKLGESASLNVKGTLNPASGERFFADLKIALKNLDLPSLSGYIEASLGKPVKTGQMNLDSDVRIEKNIIASKNHILIRKLELGDAAKSAKSGQPLGLAGGMSIDMALSMLQNDRGDVELDVPVKGPLDNPDINLANIINKALLTSLKTGAMTYAALALQPYGTIILVADVALGLIKDAAKPALTPIAFAERKAALSPQMTDYIAKIAELMEKKDFRLQVCGIATRIEGEKIIQPAAENGSNQTGQPAYAVEPALDDARLLALAGKRSALIIDTLHASGIAGNRLFNCRASIDESKSKANPRVELLLD
ncbi:MAG: DUF748 domain-containing protein [Mariprofundus sp.]|nr:DUF748 domain-containing protein [Mariprofundus sp.]